MLSNVAWIIPLIPIARRDEPELQCRGVVQRFHLGSNFLQLVCTLHWKRRGSVQVRVTVRVQGMGHGHSYCPQILLASKFHTRLNKTHRPVIRKVDPRVSLELLDTYRVVVDVERHTERRFSFPLSFFEHQYADRRVPLYLPSGGNLVFSK